MCATCEQTKRCDGCSVRKGQAEFTADAWRKCTKERLCKSCASKQKGFWTCCTCQGRKDIAAFQEWTESQGSRAQNGKQGGDACQRKRLLQSSPVRAAVTAQALRKRATERKRMRLVAEVWSEIDQRQALAHNRDEPSRKVPRLSERTTASITYTYSCPECQAEVISTCQSGRVDQRRACGHQFRVRNGVVVTRQGLAAKALQQAQEQLRHGQGAASQGAPPLDLSPVAQRAKSDGKGSEQGRSEGS